jgi:hypothetical protein
MGEQRSGCGTWIALVIGLCLLSKCFAGHQGGPPTIASVEPAPLTQLRNDGVDYSSSSSAAATTGPPVRSTRTRRERKRQITSIRPRIQTIQAFTLTLTVMKYPAHCLATACRKALQLAAVTEATALAIIGAALALDTMA